MRESVSDLSSFLSPNKYKALDPDSELIIQLSLNQHLPEIDKLTREVRLMDSQSPHSSLSEIEGNSPMSGWCEQDPQREFMVKFVGDHCLLTGKTVVAKHKNV